MAEEQRLMTGAVVRADKTWIEKNGLADSVRAQLPAGTQAVWDKPPLPVSWIPARHVDDMLDAVLKIAGEEKLMQLAEDVMRASLGPVVRPLLKTMMSLFGASPAALFGKLDSVALVFVRGASFSYEADGQNEGIVRVRTVDKPGRAWLRMWKGTLRFAFEVAQVTGTVQPGTLDADGQGAAFRVSWS